MRERMAAITGSMLDQYRMLYGLMLNGHGRSTLVEHLSIRHLYKKTPGRAGPGGRRRLWATLGYDARTARRCVATTTAAAAAAALIGLVTLARAVARAMLRALTTKHFSSAESTFASTSGPFSRITSEISETM